MNFKKITSLILSALISVSLPISSFDAVAKDNSIALYEATDASLFTREPGIGGLSITGYEGEEEEIVIPSEIDGEPVVEIGEYAFMGWSLTSVTVPEGVKKICDYAFWDCSSLETLVLPESLEEIGTGAFEGCSSLCEIFLSYNIKTIGDDIFSGCSENLTVKCYDGSPAMEYVVANGMNYESLGETELDVLKSGQCGENGSNITWEFDRFGTITIKGEGNMREYDYYYDVPWIEEELSDSIIKVVVESGVETISPYAFIRCENVEEAVLPSTLKSIGEYAFCSCISLEKINLPESLTFIGESAFYECSSLKEIEIPQNVTSLEYSVFAYSGLETITVPATLSKINQYAFSGMSDLTIRGYSPSETERFCEFNDYTFEKIGDVEISVIDSGECGNFSNDDLTWEYTSDGTLTIEGEGEMEDYYGSNVPWRERLVKRVVLSEGIETIGNYAFDSLYLVEEIEIPETVRLIGSSAFSSCISLKRINIPDSVTYIDSYAFSKCSLLKKITIPQSVAFIDTKYDTFNGCSGLVIEGYDGTMAERYAQIKGKTFESLGEPDGNMAFEINDEGSECFYSMTIDGKLTVNTTGDIQWKTYAFEKYHPVVTHLVIGDDITVISDSGYTYEYAFSNLDMVEKITIPYKVTSIGERAFEVSDASKVTIYGYSGSVAEEYAQSNGFLFESLGDAPEYIDKGSCGENLEWEVSKDGTLTISGNGPMEEFEYDYNGGYTTPWYAYKDIVKKVVIENGVTTIGYYAFPNFEYITEIYIPYTVIRFDGPIWGATIYGYTGSYAEEYSANYGNEFVSLGEIPEGAFLVDVDYGENHHWTLDVKGVLTISGTGEMPEEDSQYSYPWSDLMDSVKEVVIEEGVTTVSSNAFYEFENIRKVTTKGNMDYIGDNAFYRCTSLEEVDLSVIDTFKYGAFNGCYSLKNVEIPKGAKKIENYAFANSDSLEYVLVPYSVETIENYAFSYNSSGFTVKGYKGSEAEKHTKRVYPNLNFESLGMIPLDEEVRGTIGDNISWTLSTDGTFVMSGEGEMLPECGYNSGPWYNYKDYIKKVVITDGITSICRYAFYNHTQLSSVSLPDSLIFIDAVAFSDCPKLTEVTVPASVLGMNGAFDDYRENFTIKGYTNSAAEKYAKKYGIDFESIGVMEKEVIESGSCGENLNWTFDNTCVLKISGSGKMADYEENTVPWRKYANVISEIELSDEITHIGNNAFSFHDGLFDVELPSDLESIGSYAFMGSHNVRRYEVPKSVKHIGAYAFYETYYPILVYGNPETIGDEAFGFTRVYSEKGGSCEEFCQTSDARFYALTDSGKLGDNVTWDVDVTTGVLNITGTGEIYDYVISWFDTESDNPVDGEPPYKSGYVDLLTTINISEGITRLGDNCFYGAGVREITFPSTLESIGEYAFASCGFSETASASGSYGNGFEKIVIPESVVDIEAHAFEYTSVKKLYVPANAQIGRFAFDGTDATIYSESGSPAHAYAEDYGMPFVDTGIKPSVEISDTVCMKAEVEVLISGKNLSMGNVFAALYDESGKLLDIKMATEDYVYLEGKEYSLVKVFLWDENMKPLCVGDSREVKYKRPSSGGGGGGSSSAGGTVSGGGGSASSGTVVGDVVAQ